MKKMTKLMIATAMVSFVSLSAAETVSLPAPDKKGGKPLMQTLTERQTKRNFTKKALSNQEISNILYAAYGINRPGTGKHTIPTAINMRNLVLYVTSADGTFRYDAKNNKLIRHSKKDLREFAFMRKSMPLSSPLSLIYVADLTKGRDPASTLMYSHAHAGSAYQNVYLYCASRGLATVICGGFNKDVMAKQLGLNTKKFAVLYTQIIGFPEK